MVDGKKYGPMFLRYAHIGLVPVIYWVFSNDAGLQAWAPGYRHLVPWVSMAYILALWEGNRQITATWHRWLPEFGAIWKRLLGQCASSALFVLLMVLLTSHLLRYLGLVVASMDFDSFKAEYISGLLITYLIIAIYEGGEFYQGWKANLVKAEALAREKAEVQLALADAQLSALRDQLNPHFLFNSLNTLSSLIDLGNTAAIAYLGQLADVYRYLLEHREKDLVPLADELACCDAYIALNKTRFEEGLAYTARLGTGDQRALIPPYALQVALENAIKHNAASPGSPLRIAVSVSGDWLVATNNKQPKPVMASFGVGLENLARRCQLTTGRPLAVHDTQSRFTLKIPLQRPGQPAVAATNPQHHENRSH